VPDRSDVAPSPQVNAPDVVAMVERLAQRLQTEPHDLNGWMQLIRSYKVLHEQNKMHAAVAQARHIFEADPAALQALNQLAQD
jgi:cytochrome c-type biogenesis protein CcmH